MPVQVTTIMLGVEDLDRSKKFYGEGLGCAIDQDYPNFVSFNLGAGSSSAGAVPAGGSGRRRRCAVRGIRIPRGLVPLHRLVEGGGGRCDRQGRGGGRRPRQGSGGRALGILRVLQRPGWVSVEGRCRIAGNRTSGRSDSRGAGSPTTAMPRDCEHDAQRQHNRQCGYQTNVHTGDPVWTIVCTGGGGGDSGDDNVRVVRSGEVLERVVHGGQIEPATLSCQARHDELRRAAPCIATHLSA